MLKVLKGPEKRPGKLYPITTIEVNGTLLEITGVVEAVEIPGVTRIVLTNNQRPGDSIRVPTPIQTLGPPKN